MRAFCRELWSVGLAMACLGPAATAQDRDGTGPMPQWEGRLDAIVARAPALHAGVGLNLLAGPYARVGLTVAGGVARLADDTWHPSQRADLTVRFLLDPFAAERVGLYGGAGVSARHDGSRREDVVGTLLLVVGVEGGGTRGPRTSIELGLGGGVRLGVVLRTRRPGTAR